MNSQSELKQRKSSAFSALFETHILYLYLLNLLPCFLRLDKWDKITQLTQISDTLAAFRDRRLVTSLISNSHVLTVHSLQE